MVKDDAKKVAAFERAKKNPGNRRMATVTSVYSVEPHRRTAEDITSALFREDIYTQADANRPKPKNKNTTAQMPHLEDNGGGTTIEISAINLGIAWIDEQVQRRRKDGQNLVVLQDGQE